MRSAYSTTSSPPSASGPSSETKNTSEAPALVPDPLAEGDARGRTGGGKPLSSSDHPPAKPKIYNASVHGGTQTLTEEQKAEVDAHNAEFEKKHGKATPAQEDKVNKSFWSGKGGRNVNS